MTERIYYTEPARRSFDAVVTAVVDHEGAPALVLDRTAFYPTSGGQPFDTGRLGATDVLNTIDDGERVLHVVRTALSVGEAVHGDIDWTRRFDHMQQHTGQHVLSAAFDRVLDNRTMSFHMGGELSSIDLARDVSAVDVERCVDEANRVVWEDRPVTIRLARSSASTTWSWVSSAVSRSSVETSRPKWTLSVAWPVRSARTAERRCWPVCCCM